MRINTNTAAMNTYSRLTQANGARGNSMAKLSSGLRINKAGDDAAGLTISEKMKNQISGMKQASRNAQDGISLIQTAEGALNESHSILNRMRDLTVQAANDTNTAADKEAIQSEIQSLTSEIDRIAGDTKFNNQGLLNGKGGVTATSLNNVDASALENAYNSIHTDNTVSGNEALASALNELSETELDAVISAYNDTDTTEAALQSSDFEGDSGFDLALFQAEGTRTKDVAAAALIEYEAVNTGATMDDFVEALNNGSDATGAAGHLNTAIEDYNDNIATTTLDDIEASDIIDAEAPSNSKFSFQVGANASEKIDVTVQNMSARGLGIDGINVALEGANTDDILNTLDEAISLVSKQRADLGAVQNRLDHTVSNLSTTRENLSEANSRIRDVDMAEEMMEFTKNNILSQASTAMLAQANQMPQGVLQLLG